MLIFPVKLHRSRGIADAFAAALTYVIGSLAKKTYYSLEIGLSMPGVTALYCSIAAIGLIWTYNVLPETEGRTLEDIERHFSDKTKKLTDHNIAMSKGKGSAEKSNNNAHNDTKSGYENGGFDTTKV